MPRSRRKRKNRQPEIMGSLMSSKSTPLVEVEPRTVIILNLPSDWIKKTLAQHVKETANKQVLQVKKHDKVPSVAMVTLNADIDVLELRLRLNTKPYRGHWLEVDSVAVPKGILIWNRSQENLSLAMPCEVVSSRELNIVVVLPYSTDLQNAVKVLQKSYGKVELFYDSYHIEVLRHLRSNLQLLQQDEDYFRSLLEKYLEAVRLMAEKLRPRGKSKKQNHQMPQDHGSSVDGLLNGVSSEAVCREGNVVRLPLNEKAGAKSETASTIQENSKTSFKGISGEREKENLTKLKIGSFPLEALDPQPANQDEVTLVYSRVSSCVPLTKPFLSTGSASSKKFAKVDLKQIDATSAESPKVEVQASSSKNLLTKSSPRKSYNENSGCITECLTIGREILKLLTKNKYLHHIKTCNVDVDIPRETLTLSGPQDDVMAARAEINAVVDDVAIEMFSVNAPLAVLLCSDRGKRWIDKLLKEKCESIRFHVEVLKDGTVQCVAFTPEDAKRVASILENSLHCKKLLISNTAAHDQGIFHSLQEKFLVKVTVIYIPEIAIEVEGCGRDVEEACKFLKNHLSKKRK